MFDVNKSEKEIALAILKREIGVKNLDAETAANKVQITPEMLKDIFKNNGEFYTFQTLMFWAEIVALSCTSSDILNRKLERKVSKPPQDHFYKEVWRFISELEPDEKNQDFDNNQIND